MKIQNNNFFFKSSNYNILIVEDSKSVNNILLSTFNNKKYNTFTSFCLKDAYTIIEENSIDYIMLDINLPDGNSFELIKQLENSKVKIFVLTSETDSQFRDLIYQKGIIDFILKDKDFFTSIKEIPKTIEKIEKNRFKTILITDDSLVVREQLKDILSNRLYQIKIACNTKEAKEILANEKIDLMLLDIELGNENGLEFLKKNKSDIINIKRIPVIIISGNITSTTTREALRSGAIDIINKPYILEELILKVDLWIDYNRKDNELIESKQLLEQYKEVVDESSIVSKTDINGRITYTNDKFCEISGYTKEELLGKNHNIVRHEDVDPLIYKEIWHNLRVLKKSWSGNIKNRKKDGSSYWVKAIIKPIFDNQDKIIEYIAIRSDITQDMEVKKYFEEKLNTTTHSLQEAISLSKSYEMAMNESNMISRLDLDFNYTYVNDKFCELTAFSREELIGQAYLIVMNKHVDKTIILDIQNTLKNNKIWKGTVHNKSKKNKDYWVNIIALPIKNDDEKIIEYIIIRQDVTELFELHKDIEETQRELIYRMGEVGESRSKETGNHVKRVAQYSKELALLSGLSNSDAQTLFTASPMHDIGKVGIVDEILKKPGKLTIDEFEIMKTHSEIGFNILKGSNKPIIQAAAIVALTHHEKWDGSGYPNGLKEEDIHVFGRITAIADVFDALGSDRIYKKAWNDEDIFKLFQEEKGKHFDPNLIDLFMNNLDIFFKIRKCYTE